jgi:hypothetical protein
MSDKLYVTVNGKKREMNAAEKAQFETDLELQRSVEAEAEAKVAARQSALAKLADLGLTAEEIAAL